MKNREIKNMKYIDKAVPTTYNAVYALSHETMGGIFGESLPIVIIGTKTGFFYRILILEMSFSFSCLYWSFN
jgi:hypothetical protein